MSLINSKPKLIISGLIIGGLAAILAVLGNPGNMALCIACFIRDMAGSMHLHSAEVVQYFRPEIVGLVCGSFIISLATREYKSTAGSTPMIRFLLGFIIVIGALVFLGCPLRMVIRMAAGDLNAFIGLIGFVIGVGTGSFFLKKGFSLGRSYETHKTNGYILPGILIILFVLSLVTSLFASSETGPGSMHAPAIISLIIALIIGGIAQKNRMCFAGSIRDIFIMRDFSLLLIIGGLFISMLVYNIATGNFLLSFSGQPVSHSMHLWNILGMFVVGFASVLAGGCPMRQLILAGQGSSDSAVTVLGMLIGGAMAHNFGLASSAAKAATETDPAVSGGPSATGKVAVILCIIVLFIIATTQKRTKK